jgi:hypothetical protein
MDPNACIDRMVAAVNDNDREEYECAADDLRGWYARRGFPADSAHALLLASARRGAVTRGWAVDHAANASRWLRGGV